MSDVESNISVDINAELEAEMAAADAAAPKGVKNRAALPAAEEDTPAQDDETKEGEKKEGDAAAPGAAGGAPTRERPPRREVKPKEPKKRLSRTERKHNKREREKEERRLRREAREGGDAAAAGADGEDDNSEDDEDEAAAEDGKKKRKDDKPKKVHSAFVDFRNDLQSVNAVAAFVRKHATKTELTNPKNFGVFLQAISNKDQAFYTSLFGDQKFVATFILEKIANCRREIPLSSFALEFAIRAEDNGVKKSSWEPSDAAKETEAEKENAVPAPLLTAKEMVQAINDRDVLAKHTRRIEIARSCTDLQRASSLFEKPDKFLVGIGQASRTQLLGRLVSKVRRIDGAVADVDTISAVLDACEAVRVSGTPLGAKVPHLLKLLEDKAAVPKGYGTIVANLESALSKGQTTQAEQMTAVMLLKSALTAPDLADVLSPPVTENSVEDALAAIAAAEAESDDDEDEPKKETEEKAGSDAEGEAEAKEETEEKTSEEEKAPEKEAEEKLVEKKEKAEKKPPVMPPADAKYPRLTLTSPDVLSAVAVAVQNVRKTAEADDALLVAELQEKVFTLLTHAVEEGAVLPRRAKAFVDEEERNRRAAEQAAKRPRLEEEGDSDDEKDDDDEEADEDAAIEAEAAVEARGNA